MNGAIKVGDWVKVRDAQPSTGVSRAWAGLIGKVTQVKRHHNIADMKDMYEVVLGDNDLNLYGYEFAVLDTWWKE